MYSVTAAKYHHCIWQWSTFGIPKYGRMALLGAAGAIGGEMVGMYLWGNPTEYWNLKFNGSLYKKELSAYHESHY